MVSTDECNRMANDANGFEASDACNDHQSGAGPRVRVHGAESGSFR